MIVLVSAPHSDHDVIRIAGTLRRHALARDRVVVISVAVAVGVAETALVIAAPLREAAADALGISRLMVLRGQHSMVGQGTAQLLASPHDGSADRFGHLASRAAFGSGGLRGLQATEIVGSCANRHRHPLGRPGAIQGLRRPRLDTMPRQNASHTTAASSPRHSTPESCITGKALCHDRAR